MCEPYWSATSKKQTPRSSAWRTTRVNPLTPSRVWLLAWPEPTLPVPMPTSETWMPVLPRVTLSVGPLGRLRLRGAAAVAAVAGGGGQGGGRGGRLGEEVAAVQGRCHGDRSPRVERFGT